MYWTTVLATEAAESGGLFDFDATLPLMAVQFLILVALLNAIFYKPLSKVLDERDDYIRNSNRNAREQLEKVQQLAAEYDRKLASTRREAQETIAAARQEAQAEADAEIAEAQRQANQERERVAAELEEQKQAAMAAIDEQATQLSRQILEKLLGSDLVKS